MGQNHSLELTDEEKKELSIGLLRDWYLTATQALVDSVGSEKALASMKQYCVHGGKAGGINFKKLAGISSDDPFAQMIGQGITLSSIVESGTLSAWLAEDCSSIYEIHDCSTKDLCKEACICWCDYTSCNSIMEVYPNFEVRLNKSLAFGDSHCEWRISRIGSSPQVTRAKRFLVPADVLQSYAPSKELQEYLGHAWSGEMWVLATRSFIDSVGSEKALERLSFYMRHSGMSVGMRLSDRLIAHERKVDSAVDLVQLIQELHYRKGIWNRSPNQAEGMVEECPFSSSSPPEICEQYQAFFNGICEAIDPSYEFAYDRMMTKGDLTCHWVVKKKETEHGKTSKQAYSDDPARALAMRFAKGEISHEEFDRSMELLKKHSVVK